MQIAIAGTGYVGLSNAVLLAVILSNRQSEFPADVADKVYTRDLFGKDRFFT